MSKLARAYCAAPRRTRVAALAACALALAVIVTSHLVSATLARYTASAESPNDARVALFGHNETIDFGNAWTAHLKPGDTRTIALTVSNTENGKVSEVAQTYDIEVETAGNLPLSFTLAEGGTDIAEAAGESTSTTASQTHVFKADNMAFSAATAEVRIYTLTVTWPRNIDAARHADIPDYLQVNVNVKQTD